MHGVVFVVGAYLDILCKSSKQQLCINSIHAITSSDVGGLHQQWSAWRAHMQHDVCVHGLAEGHDHCKVFDVECGLHRVVATQHRTLEKLPSLHIYVDDCVENPALSSLPYTNFELSLQSTIHVAFEAWRRQLHT